MPPMKRLLLAAALTLLATPSAQARLPFIEDDFTKAVALAKTKKIPIFVEAWAPW